jgi:lipopolysaccharide export system protein LptA
MNPSPSNCLFKKRIEKDLRRWIAPLLCLLLTCPIHSTLPIAIADRSFISSAWAADSPPPEPVADTEAPIEITADRLISDSQNHLARFEGNVKAVQGDTTIEADRLLIYYKAEGNPQPTAGADALSKLVASGNVRIKFDNRLAVTDEAVYITDQRILTLTGTPARVTSDQDQVSGKVIKFYRDSGRIEVQGGGGKQIEAIFHSGEKGIQ